MMTILFEFALSFIASVLVMMIAYYTHLRIEFYNQPDFDKSDVDKLGLIYSRIVGPVIWLTILILINI